MTQEELILERLDRLEAQMAPVAASARSMGELKEELTPRVNEAVQALIVGLADIESDFQLEDLTYLLKKLLRNVNNLNFSLDQLKNLIDFVQTAEPMLKSTVPQMILFLDDLEQKGVFRLLGTSLEVLKNVSDSFSAEDLKQIGDGMVRLGGVLKKITEPQAVAFIKGAAEIPGRVEPSKAKEVGLFGMLGAMGDREIKQGMGVLLELTRGLAVLIEGSTTPAAVES